MIDLDRLKHLDKAKVLVVGDIMLDRYYLGDSHRISPEAPVPVVQIKNIEDRAGGAANVARNIAYLEGQTTLLGLVGEDTEAQVLANLLKTHGVQTEFIHQNDLPTIAKMRVISRQQQIVRLDIEQPFEYQHSQLLTQKLPELLARFDVLVLSDYNKGSLLDIQAMIQLAKAQQKTVLIDPKQTDLSVYQGADLITPNLHEFKLVGGQTETEQSIQESARAILKAYDIGALLLTRSEQGMSLITADNFYHYPAQVIEVSDVTGAGDTVIGTLATLLGAGFPLHEAVELANLAAGIVVAKRGTSVVSSQELIAKAAHYLLQQYKQTEVLSFNQLQTPESQAEIEKVLQHIQVAKQLGEKIVFTNGCFDILHAGHVRYLTQAKALGTRLVVGLNSDASVKRLKGAERPINDYQDRARVLSALASVDWVIPFGDTPSEKDTPLALILAVMPDVLVKGGDYQIADIVGASEVIAAGGDVKLLDFVAGRSTTSIIKKAQQNLNEKNLNK